MTIETMIAFHGDPAIKEFYRARLQGHYDADEIVQGVYWEDGKGCAVGCLIHSGDHSQFPELFGIPESIACLMDGIFEELPNDQAKEFPLRFWDAVPVGADLSGVIPRFLHWLLVDEKDGVIQYASTDDRRAAIQQVADLYARIIRGTTVEFHEWRAAYAACAACSNATAYAVHAADGFVDAAADAARAAAAAAAADAAYAAYAADAYAAARIAQRDKLIELIRETAE